MNEAETRAELIDPALRAAGWGVVEGSRVRREYIITLGRLQGAAGRRSKQDIADYVLEYKGRMLAVVEAKKADLAVTEGLGQAKKYADKLKLRHAFSTNGRGIYQVDMLSGREGDVGAWPTPEELWGISGPEPVPERSRRAGSSTSSETGTGSGTGLQSVPEPVEGIDWTERFGTVPFEDKGGTWQMRYYQSIAVQRVMDAIAQGKDRLLLTLATGTGKTAIAFQVAWKLFHARWNLRRFRNASEGQRTPRILFLADRNILADQAFNAFSAFEEDALVRIDPASIRKKGRVPTNGSIFFTIFQTFMASAGSATERLEDGVPSTVPYRPTFKEVTEIEDAYGYMYILECADGSFYVGSTKYLSTRVEQHQNGEGANYTAAHLPVKLIYYEGFARIDEAFLREKQVQRWSRAKKIALIQGDLEKLKELSKAKNATPDPEPVEGAGVAFPDPSRTDPDPSRTDPEPTRTDPEPVEGYFGDYPRDFFDFIVIDECHRGGANDESTWRAILEYFSPAVQLGLTATPKRDVNTDTYRYFGEPVYVYSLKEGINDGFLTPFKVKEYRSTMDEYTFVGDDEVVEGSIEAGTHVAEEEFNVTVEIREREAFRVRTFLQAIPHTEKTLVFCANQPHAQLVRDLVNQYKTSTDPNYCHRVTADDGKIGEEHLRDFQDNERHIPTILTTSQKLSTGVDARNVRHIVLMRRIKSMVEFKQIIGRGTRLYEGKDYFTIHDFTKSHELFKDPAWDGEEMDPVPPSPPRGPKPYGEPPDTPPEPSPAEPRPVVRIRLADGKERQIQHTVKTSFWSPDGTPISAEQFIRLLFGELPRLFADEAELRTLWSRPDTRKKLLDELAEKGFPINQLQELQRIIDAEHSDLYDVLAYIGYSQTPQPRTARAAAAQSHLDAYGDNQRAFLDFVLQQYVNDGVQELSEEKLPPLLLLKYRSLPDATRQMGDIARIRETFMGFQQWLYAEASHSG